MVLNKKMLIASAAPFSFVLGTLYLWGYWSSFGINVFEYASLSDAAFSAVIPLLTAFIGLALGLMQGISNPLLTINSTEDEIRGAFVVRTALAVSVVVLVSISILALESISFAWRAGWLIVFSPIFLLPNIFFKATHEKPMGTAILVTLCVCFISFATGKSNAHKILEGSEYMQSNIDNEELRYIGHLHENFFFCDQSNRTVTILRGDETNKITLQKIKTILPTGYENMQRKLSAIWD